MNDVGTTSFHSSFLISQRIFSRWALKILYHGPFGALFLFPIIPSRLDLHKTRHLSEFYRYCNESDNQTCWGISNFVYILMTNLWVICHTLVDLISSRASWSSEPSWWPSKILLFFFIGFLKVIDNIDLLVNPPLSSYLVVQRFLWIESFLYYFYNRLVLIYDFVIKVDFE